MDLLQVTFTAFNTVRGDKKPFTIYEIEVRGLQTVTWIVYKRYNDFFTLHAELVKVLPKFIQLPNVPPKRMTRSLVSDFVEKRKQELQIYMSELLRITQVVGADVLLRFLEVPDSVKPIIIRKLGISDGQENETSKGADLKKNLNKEESRVHELVSTLKSSATGKVAAIKSFDKYFFEAKPKCSSELISVLYNGVDNQGGLIEAVGNFESKVAARAALEFLKKLLDIERNKDAPQFVDVFIKLDSKSFSKLKLYQHIRNDYNSGAFEICALITEKIPHIGIERLIPDLEGLAYFKRWLERKQQIAKPYIIDSKENFLSSPVLQDVEYKTLADYTFEDLAKIQENDQGWRFVNDETGKAIQVVYKKSGDQMILRVGLAIAQPVEQVFDVLMNLNRHTEWNVKFHKGKLVKQISENIDIIHEVYKSFNSPYKYRDFCLLRSWKKDNDGSYIITYRSVHHPEVPEVRDNVRASMQTSGIQLTPYITNGESGPMAFTLFLWIAQLDREGILIYTPDLLNETDELFRSFHNLRTVLFDDSERNAVAAHDSSSRKADTKKSPDGNSTGVASKSAASTKSPVRSDSEVKCNSSPTTKVGLKPIITDAKPTVPSTKPTVFPAATKALPRTPTDESKKPEPNQGSVASRLAAFGGGKS